MPSGSKGPMIPIKEVVGKSGRLILIEEESDIFTIERFNIELSTTSRALVITTVHPSKISPRLKAGKVKWLSRTKGGLDPLHMDYDVYQMVTGFFKEGGGLLLVEGLEYLCHTNGFKKMARFIKKVCDRASATGGTLLSNINPMAFDNKEVLVLEKAFDYVEKKGAGVRIVQSLSLGEPARGSSYLFLDMKAYRAFKETETKGPCVSTMQPEKVRRWDGFQGDVIWISESEEGGSIHPSKLRFEVQQRLMRKITEEGATVFVDGLDNLMVHNGLEEVVGFIKSISDCCSINGGNLLAYVDAKALDRRDLTLFKRLFDKVLG